MGTTEERIRLREPALVAFSTHEKDTGNRNRVNLLCPIAQKPAD